MILGKYDIFHLVLTRVEQAGPAVEFQVRDHMEILSIDSGFAPSLPGPCTWWRLVKSSSLEILLSRSKFDLTTLAATDVAAADQVS